LRIYIKCVLPIHHKLRRHHYLLLNCVEPVFVPVLEAGERPEVEKLVVIIVRVVKANFSLQAIECFLYLEDEERASEIVVYDGDVLGNAWFQLDTV
jgi:hypothetical protein